MPKGVPNKRYTAEFKKMVIETMIEEKLGYSETARKFDVCDYHRIQNWERIYLEEGPDAFSIGRPRKIPKEIEEDLLAEVQRLRAENEYLKKLHALVLEGERRQRRK